MKTRILIADNHKMVRQAIGSLLNGEMGLEVVGEAGDGRCALELARELHPDVVVMAVTMPNLNGIEATRRLTQELPGVKVVMLSEKSDTRCVSEALRAGAAGFVPKTCDAAELVEAIRSVAAKHTYLSPEVTGVVVEGLIHHLPEHSNSAYSVLTDREREVLQLIAEGLSTKEIAKELHLSAKTIEWHRSQLMKKLNLSSIAKLVKYAINEGLTCASI